MTVAELLEVAPQIIDFAQYTCLAVVYTLGLIAGGML